MKKHYFISDNLDDLDKLEQKLERSGVVTPQQRSLNFKGLLIDHKIL